MKRIRTISRPWEPAMTRISHDSTKNPLLYWVYSSLQNSCGKSGSVLEWVVVD